MVSIDVFDQIDAVRLDQANQFLLQIQSSLRKFYGLLHNPAPITILRKLQDVLLDNMEKPLLVRLLSILKQFLKDIVSKLILGEFDAFLDE